MQKKQPMKKPTIILAIFVSVFLNAQTVDNQLYNLFLQRQYTKVLEAAEITDSLKAADFYYAGLSADALDETPLAVSYFTKSIALDSAFIPAKIGLAQSLFKNEEFTNAIEIYAKLLETDTLNPFLWSKLGDCYAKIGFHPLAYLSYKNAFYLNPKNSVNTLKLVSALIASKPEDYLEESFFIVILI